MRAVVLAKGVPAGIQCNGLFVTSRLFSDGFETGDCDEWALAAAETHWGLSSVAELFISCDHATMSS